VCTRAAASDGDRSSCRAPPLQRFPMRNAFRNFKTSPEITRLVMRSLQKSGAAHAWSPQPFQPRPIPRPSDLLQGPPPRGPRRVASAAGLLSSKSANSQTRSRSS